MVRFFMNAGVEEKKPISQQVRVGLRTNRSKRLRQQVGDFMEKSTR